VGYASAVSYILFAVCLIWSLIIIKVVGTKGAHE
jgi:hypothetical protein